jgi:hypothetical protein
MSLLSQFVDIPNGSIIISFDNVFIVGTIQNDDIIFPNNIK